MRSRALILGHSACLQVLDLFGRKMILPGLVSAAFYRRRPSAAQVALGLIFTIAGSGALGYIQDVGTPRVWLNVTVAIIGGVVLYVAILAYIVYYYLPRKAARVGASAPPE